MYKRQLYAITSLQAASAQYLSVSSDEESVVFTLTPKQTASPLSFCSSINKNILLSELIRHTVRLNLKLATKIINRQIDKLYIVAGEPGFSYKLRNLSSNIVSNNLISVLGPQIIEYRAEHTLSAWSHV